MGGAGSEHSGPGVELAPPAGAAAPGDAEPQGALFDADAAQAAVDADPRYAHRYSPACAVALMHHMARTDLPYADRFLALFEISLTGALGGWHDRPDRYFARVLGIHRQAVNERRRRLRRLGYTALSARQPRGRAHRTVVGPMALLVMDTAWAQFEPVDKPSTGARGVRENRTPGVRENRTPGRSPRITGIREQRAPKNTEEQQAMMRPCGCPPRGHVAGFCALEGPADYLEPPPEGRTLRRAAQAASEAPAVEQGSLL